MAGQLVQVATSTVTSAVASVTLTGIDSDDVYIITVMGYIPETDDKDLFGRITKASDSSADSTANYDRAEKLLRTDTTYSDSSATNETQWRLANGTGNATGETAHCILYLYNFNNSSEYSFITFEQTGLNKTSVHMGKQGGAVMTVAQSCNGINFFVEGGGNIDSGTFTLYKVV